MTAQDFVIKDYELKIRYMTDHLSRMWSRFNYMLGIQTAIAGGKFFLDNANNCKSEELAFGVIGFLFALLWYLLGAQDRYLFELYRKQVEKAFTNLGIDNLPKELSYVGRTQEAWEDKCVTKAWHTWRIESISSTKMVAIVPMVIMVLWVVYSVCIYVPK